MHKKEHKLAELLKCVTKFDLRIDWEQLRDFRLQNLKRGFNHIGIADLIVAQNCMQNGLKLLVCDRHFEALAQYLPLDLQILGKRRFAE
jgi:hypothetical protein